MIESQLSLAESRWLLQRLQLAPTPDSPLREPLERVAAAPAASPAENDLVTALTGRGLVLPAGINPLLATALEWLTRPERVLTLTAFGPEAAGVVHLALREGSGVECLRTPTGFRLRYPLTTEDLEHWVQIHVKGAAGA